MKRLYRLPLITSIIATFVSVLAVGSNKATDSCAGTQKLESKITRKIDHDFGSESAPEGLTVSVTSSTKTSIGQSFSFQFSTGGQGFGDTTDTYLIAPDDENFTAFFNDFQLKSIEERTEIQKQYKAGEYETQIFDSYIYSITGKVQYKDIVIPRALKRDVFFQLNVLAIGANAISQWDNVDSITIPKEVTTIYSNSFVNVPETMVFKVEYNEDEIPNTWAADWNHGATVQYGASISSKKEYPLSKAGAAMYGDDKISYILGWHKPGEEALPLVAEYKVTKDGVVSETKYIDFKLNSKASYYDCVGKEIFDYRNELNLDIPVNEGEEVIFESVVLHNIFPATKDENRKIVPDTTKPCVVQPQKLFSNCYDIADFIDFKFTRLAAFGKYTSIDIELKIAEDKNIYSVLKSNYYKSHKNALDSKKEYIRYRITSLTLCSFKVVYDEDGKDVTKLIKIKTPVNQFIINNGAGEMGKTNKLGFLLKNSDISDNSNFKTKQIKALSFESFYITIDLFGEKGPVARSNVTTRFGFLTIMPYTEKAKTFNANAFVIIFASVYAALYIASTIVLFFVLSEKYKNDEFRRMKPKSFIKKAIYGLLGSTITILFVIFLILRTGVFNNVIVTFNPVDAYVIVTGVLSVIIIGYFIKYLVVTIKTVKERKRVIKLGLNENEDDDGTK